MVRYTDSLEGIEAAHLRGGFFAGWPSPPAPEDHLRILRGSAHVELALEGDAVVGFVTAITDGVSAAYIPHLEVLATHQGRGIGSELVRRMLARLSHLYMVDLLCDADVQPFYARLGMRPAVGMLARSYARQSCAPLAE